MVPSGFDGILRASSCSSPTRRQVRRRALTRIIGRVTGRAAADFLRVARHPGAILDEARGSPSLFVKSHFFKNAWGRRRDGTLLLSWIGRCFAKADTGFVPQCCKDSQLSVA